MDVRERGGPVLIVSNIPNPYRIALFNELDEQMRTAGLELMVVFGASGYERRKWTVDMSGCRFRYEILKGSGIHFLDPERTSFTYLGLGGILKREKPPVVITSGFSPATMKLWLRSFYKSSPYIIWSGAINRMGRADSAVRTIQRKMLIGRAAGFIAYGTRAAEYLVSLGAGRDSIRIAINTVETEFFRRETGKIRGNMDGKNSERILLYVGNLTRGKRVDRLLRALRSLSGRREDHVLEIVGDGPEMGNLKRLSVDMDISKHVRFLGYRPREEMPIHLARADCFLFPSEYDIWGLALVEAMASGVPCISSVDAGATFDLIEDGQTGFAMDFKDHEAVADRIDWILGHQKEAQIMGRRAAVFISENASLKISASGFVEAVSAVLEAGLYQ